MREYEFTLVLSKEPDESEADRLYQIFDDGSIATISGVPLVMFDREAESLMQAIHSATKDVEAAGFNAVRVEFEPDQIQPSEVARTA